MWQREKAARDAAKAAAVKRDAERAAKHAKYEVSLRTSLAPALCARDDAAVLCLNLLIGVDLVVFTLLLIRNPTRTRI